MSLFWLPLVVFFALAVVAMAWFVRLTRQQSTPRREDWKRFLTSFAGTALALSVGFVSVILQQNDQALRKVSEENAQMRARLVYSVAQKKIELRVLTALSFAMSEDALKYICDASIDEGERDQRLQQTNARSSDSAMQLQLLKETYESLFAATGTFEQNPLNRLMKETGFASRVSDTMLAHFLDKELQLDFLGPKVFTHLVDLILGTRSKPYCERGKMVMNNLHDVLRDGSALQAASCAAYAVIVLPTEGSRRISSAVMDEIDKSFNADAEELAAGVANHLGSAAEDFRRCWASAKIKLATEPASPPGK